MGYSFKVAAKQNIGGKIGKGMTVQVFEKSTTAPSLKSIIEAFQTQLGIDLKNISVSTGYFTYEKL